MLNLCFRKTVSFNFVALLLYNSQMSVVTSEIAFIPKIRIQQSDINDLFTIPANSNNQTCITTIFRYFGRVTCKYMFFCFIMFHVCLF